MPARLKYVDPNHPRGSLSRAFAEFSSTRLGRLISRKVVWKVDPYLLRATRGRVGMGLVLPTALLETRGAKSGAVRRNAVIYFHDGDRVTIVASKAGAERHPAWFHNLRTHPDVSFGGIPMRATVISDEAERRRLWTLADRVFAPYATYRREAARANRTIPIVQLSTRSSPQHRWTAVDDYIAEHLLPADAALDAAVADSAAAGLPPISVTPNQGKLLQLLARMQGARSILELGTLGGYSTIWLARALAPGGRLVTLEAEPRYAALARANIARAGFAELVELRVGPALQTLPELHAEGAGPFDLIFIDADKQNNPGYFEWSLRLSRPGTLIVVDNVIRDGAILDPDADDPTVGNDGIRGVRRFFELVAAEVENGSVSATAIQTVGAKGYDGFALLLVEGTG
jgi:deazaflavin-dependent oxidoreductase (nitroreductase family)